MGELVQGRSKYSDEDQLPPVTAYDVDNLAADCAVALGGEDAKEIADQLRNRSPVKGMNYGQYK